MKKLNLKPLTNAELRRIVGGNEQSQFRPMNCTCEGSDISFGCVTDEGCMNTRDLLCESGIASCFYADVS